MLKIVLGMFIAYALLASSSIAGLYVLHNPEPGAVCKKDIYQCMKDEYPKTMVFVEIFEINPVQYVTIKILNTK